MKYLILSDIHSNLEALTAVLRFVRRKHFDRIVMLGDLVGYGASPNPTLEALRSLRRTIIIRGNHDKVCSGLEDGEMFNRVALESAKWTQQTLHPRHRTWLASLPQGPLEVDGLFLISHGTPLDEDAYIFGELEALNIFRCFELRVCFFGHSHFPVIFRLDAEALTTHIPQDGSFRLRLNGEARYLINPGSIGQPRDGDNRASFAIFDSEKKTIAIHRVGYNLERAQRKIREAGLPGLLADRLALGR